MNPYLKSWFGVPVVVHRKWIWLGTMRLQVRSLDFLSGLRIWHCRELWCRLWCSSNPALLWPWCRQAAVALIGPLAWAPPCAACAALRSKRKKKAGLPNIMSYKNISFILEKLSLAAVKHETKYLFFFFFFPFPQLLKKYLWKKWLRLNLEKNGSKGNIYS